MKRSTHLGHPGPRSFNRTPTSAGIEGGGDWLQIEFKPVERKVTSRHEVDSRPLSEWLGRAWDSAARQRRSFHEDFDRGELSIHCFTGNFHGNKAGFCEEDPYSRIRLDRGSAGIFRATEYDFSRRERDRACGARRA